MATTSNISNHSHIPTLKHFATTIVTNVLSKQTDTNVNAPNWRIMRSVKNCAMPEVNVNPNICARYTGLLPIALMVTVNVFSSKNNCGINSINMNALI